MAEGLKPCPFCGGEVQILKATPRIHRYRDFIYCVYCSECELLFGYDEDYGGIFATEEEAADAWNRRANDDQGAAGREDHANEAGDQDGRAGAQEGSTEAPEADAGPGGAV